MKRTYKTLLVIFAFAVLTVPALHAEPGAFGAGVVIGSNTGVSVALRLTDVNTIQASFGWSFVDSKGLSVTADYLFHFDDILSIQGTVIPVYLGVGGKAYIPFSDNGDFTLGARVPVGLRWLFTSVPVEVFVEVAPGLKLYPKTAGIFDVGLGGRWYF